MGKIMVAPLEEKICQWDKYSYAKWEGQEDMPSNQSNGAPSKDHHSAARIKRKNKKVHEIIIIHHGQDGANLWVEFEALGKMRWQTDLSHKAVVMKADRLEKKKN